MNKTFVSQPAVTHKTDIRGVQLNLTDAEAVRWAYGAIATSVQEKVGSEHFLGVTVQPMVHLDGGYELILGSSIDPQFGSILLFGTGGQLVEVFRDRVIALPPLNTTLARRLMEQTQIYQALQGVRGRKAIDVSALEQLLVRFSQLVVEQRWIKEIDINPLFVSPVGAHGNAPFQVLDARIIFHGSEVLETELLKLAIRPYPSQYSAPQILRDGTQVTIRPIRPEDKPQTFQFHKTLSEESVYFRYFHLVKLSHRIAHERLMRLCFIDYDREMALIADRKDPVTGIHEMLAVGRLSKMHVTQEAEFALLVSDAFQRQGLGTELLQRLVKVGRDENLTRIVAQILPENAAMQRVCEKVGFAIAHEKEIVRAAIDL